MIRSIEGVRGIAALMVALFHIFVFAHWGGFLTRFDVLREAWLFVDLFFVVSGFVMAANYMERIATLREAAAFMVRRFFRLYPLHAVTTATVLFAVIAVQTTKLIFISFGVRLGGEPPFTAHFFDPVLLVLEALMLHGLDILPPHGVHNYPAWSISVEFWMYLVFALFVLAVRSRALRIVLSALIVAGCIAWFLARWAELEPAQWTLDVRGLTRGLLSFFQGVLIHYLWAAVEPSVRRLDDRLLSAAQVGVTAFTIWIIGNQGALGVWHLAIPTVFAAWMLVLLPDRGLVARVLQTGPCQWLGVHSYSIYLGHITVQIWLDWPARVIPYPWRYGVGLAFLVGLFVMSWLTYRYVEVPWRDRGKRIAARIERYEPRRRSDPLPLTVGVPCPHPPATTSGPPVIPDRGDSGSGSPAPVQSISGSGSSTCC